MNNQEPEDFAVETIMIDWATSQRGIKKVSRTGDAFKKMQGEAERALNIAMGNIRSMAWRVAKTMDELDEKARPNEAEVEFGLNLDAEAGVILFFPRQALVLNLRSSSNGVLNNLKKLKLLLVSKLKGRDD